MQSGDLLAFHGLCRKLIGVDATGRDLRLGIALCGFRSDGPVMHLALQLGESMVGPAFRWMQLDPAISKTMGQDCAECNLQRSEISPLTAAYQSRQIAAGRQVN